MVFKTIESDVTRSGQALSIFGKQINYIFNDINSAINEIKTNGLSKQSLSLLSPSKIFGSQLSKQDIQALRDYNEALKDCLDEEGNLISTNTVFYKHLGNASSAAQELARNANGAAVSEEVLAQATNKVTTATKLAHGAMRLLANVGLALAINLIITGITKAVNRFKEIKESTDNLISSFKSLKEETDDLAKNSNTLVSEYSKLAKGVNSLGENVSLTADEYERYKEVANQIAEDIPSLIIGYDNEGNAILKLKDNVDELKQSYIDARKEKYRLMLEEDQTTDDAIKNYQHLKETSVWAGAFDFGNADVGGRISAKEAVEVLRTAMNSTYEELKDMLPNAGANDSSDILHDFGVSYLSSLGFDVRTTEEEFLELQKVFRTELQKLEAEIDNGLTGIRSIANMYLFTNDDYYNLSTDMQNIASIIVNGIPDDLAETWENKYDINEYVYGVVQKLKNATPDIQSAYRNLFNLSLNDLSIPEAKKQVDEYIQEIADYLDLDANQLKIQLGFEVVDSNEDELNRVISRTFQKYNGYKQEKIAVQSVNELSEGINERGVNTKEELSILTECIDKTDSVTKALELYDIQVKQTKSDNEENIRSLEELQEAYDELSKSTSTYTSSQKTLSDAFEEQEKHGQLSASTIQSLADAGYAQALSVDAETGAVTLNVKAYEWLNEQKRQAIVLEAEQQKSELEQKFQEESKAITELAIEMQYANQERREAIALEMQQHGLAMADIEEQMAKVDALARSANAPIFESSSSSSSNDDPWKDEAQSKIADVEHLYAMEQITYEEYINEIDKINQKYFANNEKYLDDYRKYEEKVYEGRKKFAEEDFNNKHKQFEKYVDYLKDYADELSETSITSDGTKLNTQEKFREIAAVYTEIQNEIQSEINRIIQVGVEGNEELLEELEKQLKEYADKITDTFKSAVETEKSLLENQKSSLSDVYDKEIDKIKKQQEDSQNAADAEIDLIQEKIDNLKKVNDEKQQEYDIEKAKQDLEKSKQRTRKVYDSGGRVVYKQDTDKNQEAQQNLDKLLLEKQINTLETQKSLLEDMRDKESESYDKLIEDIESQKKQDERQFDILIQRLEEYLNPNSDTSNSDVWSEIAKMDGASYKNGKWVDKNGTEIDIAALIAKADKKNGNNSKSDNNPKADNNVKSNTISKNSTKTGNDTVNNADEIDKGEAQTDNVNEQLETAANAMKEVAVSADDFVNTILNTLGVSSVKDLWAKSSNGVPDGNKMLSEQHNTTKWSASRDNYTINNDNKSQPVNVTFSGGINIQNPVGEVQQLAKEILLQLPTATARQIYSNLK